MRKIFHSCFAVLVLAAFIPGSALGQTQKDKDALRRIGGAIVSITTAGGGTGNQAAQSGEVFKEFFEKFFKGKKPEEMSDLNQLTASRGSGTAVVIDPRGYALTASNVVSGATRISATLADGRTVGAILVGSDSMTDLAILKIDVPGDIPYLTWGDSQAARVGESILIISRKMDASATTLRSRIAEMSIDINAGPYDDFIRSDPDFTFGNSGSPMLDNQDRIIGLLLAVGLKKGQTKGPAYFIPETIARPIAQQLISYGRVRRGWLGVHIQGVTKEIADTLGLKKAEGALVASIVEGSPAEQAKLKRGDVILVYNGQRVKEMRLLPRLVANTPVGQSVPTRVWRKGRMISLNIRLGELEEEPSVASTPTPAPTQPSRGSSIVLSEFGVTLSPLTENLRNQFNIENDVTGVVVTAVDPNGSAAKKGVTAGDVFSEVNQVRVGTPTDVIAQIVESRNQGKKVVLVLAENSQGRRFIALKRKPGAATPEPSPSIATAPLRVTKPPAQTPRFSGSSLPVRYRKGSPRPDDIAVIIGNADYTKQGKDIPDITPAYADADSFRRYVIEALGIREGNIIDLRDATGSQLARVFGNERQPKGQLFDWVRPGRSNVIVYYAGHGAPSGGDGSAYLVPSDADAARIDINGYPLGIFYKNLSQIPAKSITVVLEACFSGAAQGGSVISNASPVYLKTKAPPIPDNITVISAGGAQQMASWEEDKSHGLFTKYYLMGMSGEADANPYGNGDGNVDHAELDAYLKDTMTYYARRYYGRDQTAVITAGK